jgi:hypothetical protein
LEKCSEVVQQLLSPYSVVGVTYHWNCIFCIPFWIFFPKNSGAISDEHDERFHQDISQLERSRVGNGVQMFWLTAASLIRERGTGEYKRQKKAKRVFNYFFVVRVPCTDTLFIIWYCLL